MEPEESKQIGHDSIQIILGEPEHAQTCAEFAAKKGLELENYLVDTTSIAAAIDRLVSNQEEVDGYKPYGWYLVAIDDTKTLLGCMMVTREINPTVGGLIYMMHSIYVLKEHRKKGIFKKMFTKVQEMANKDPLCKGMRLYVRNDNETGQKVYLKLGMKLMDYSVNEREILD
ncbi:unnamed protein product [Moneuplotes crassus]|uniref:N-acetyltransferase domain-containing protein n=1 Tax=Euplotes crassus TaxID=5936 RepID=A0AAD1XVE0_EUPCR|nr:unnamed protein product [Moneuplotes crassus]